MMQAEEKRNPKSLTKEERARLERGLGLTTKAAEWLIAFAAGESEVKRSSTDLYREIITSMEWVRDLVYKKVIGDISSGKKEIKEDFGQICFAIELAKNNTTHSADAFVAALLVAMQYIQRLHAEIGKPRTISEEEQVFAFSFVSSLFYTYERIKSHSAWQDAMKWQGNREELIPPEVNYFFKTIDEAMYEFVDQTWRIIEPEIFLAGRSNSENTNKGPANSPYGIKGSEEPPQQEDPTRRELAVRTEKKLPAYDKCRPSQSEVQ